MTVAYDEQAAERVRRALSRRRDLVETRMMGGTVFMVDGSMCCGVTGSALMIRVGREAYAGVLARPHVRPMEFAGRRPRGFVLVDPAGYRTDAALMSWLQRGLDYIATLPAKASAARGSRRQAPRRRRQG